MLISSRIPAINCRRRCPRDASGRTFIGLAGEDAFLLLRETFRFPLGARFRWRALVPGPDPIKGPGRDARRLVRVFSVGDQPATHGGVTATRTGQDECSSAS